MIVESMYSNPEFCVSLLPSNLAIHQCITAGGSFHPTEQSPILREKYPRPSRIGIDFVQLSMHEFIRLFIHSQQVELPKWIKIGFSKVGERMRREPR